MKQLIKNKQLITASILGAIALTIWVEGPKLQILGNYPLTNSEQRFYVALLIMLIWPLKYVFFDAITPVSPKRAQPSKMHPELAKKINLLQGRFQGAVNFLKKTYITKHGKNVKLTHLPWYLLIGPTGAGKTTLLANANINFILAKQFKPDSLKTITPSDCCDWWVTRDVVLVDVPGSYFQSKHPVSAAVESAAKLTDAQKHTASAPSVPKLWTNLLSLITQHRGRKKLGGVVVALNLPELINPKYNQQRDQLIQDLKQRILEIKEKFGHNTAIYFVVTKCDLIPGFLEFFSDSTGDETSQAWGITIPALKENEKLIDVFATRFNALIKRINKQLLWRLHQERNPFARPAIKDFPLQIERLKDSLSQLIKMLSLSDTPTNLAGVYLTSGIQHPMDNPNASHAASGTLQILRSPAPAARAFFVKQFILQGLLNSADHHALASDLPNMERRRKIMYAFSTSLIVIAAVVLGVDFRNNVMQAYSIKNGLTQYHTALQQPEQQGGSRLINTLPLLNSLQTAVNDESRHFSFFSSKTVQNTTAAYNGALASILLPEIRNYLEKSLSSPIVEKNPQLLYAVLKSYLMLGDSDHLQVAFITRTLKQILPSTMSTRLQEQLNSHITVLFNGDWQPLQLNNNAIATARKHLQNLTSLELSYVILADSDDNNTEVEITLNHSADQVPVIVTKSLASNMLRMFTAEAFETDLNQGIDTAATEAIQGNWVLGNLPSSGSQSPDSLAIMLRQSYVANYAQAWETLINSIKLINPGNLAQMNTMLNALTSPDSQLVQLLQIIKQNTNFALVTAASPKIQMLNSLISDVPGQDNIGLNRIIANLKQLTMDMQPLTNTNNPSKVAFEIASARMQSAGASTFVDLHEIANECPDPLKTWINNIVTQTWSYVLQNASIYINQNWQSTVMSAYNNHIADRYPFADSDKDVDLAQLTAFLGRQGTLSKFYQEYLKLFVDESQSKWTWKVVDNQKLPFSQSVLDQLQQAYKIQQAFFPAKENKLAVQFTLQPIGMTNSVKSFYLNINGQPVEHDAKMPLTPLKVTWPGTINTHSTALNFVSTNNKSVNNTLDGDWAWFRLVNKSTKKVINDNKQLVLSFNPGDKEEHSQGVEYLLTMSGQVNPFIPDNLIQLKLPQNLS